MNDKIKELKAKLQELQGYNLSSDDNTYDSSSSSEIEWSLLSGADTKGQHKKTLKVDDVYSSEEDEIDVPLPIEERNLKDEVQLRKDGKVVGRGIVMPNKTIVHGYKITDGWVYVEIRKLHCENVKCWDDYPTVSGEVEEGSFCAWPINKLVMPNSDVSDRFSKQPESRNRKRKLFVHENTFSDYDHLSGDELNERTGSEIIWAKQRKRLTVDDIYSGDEVYSDDDVHKTDKNESSVGSNVENASKQAHIKVTKKTESNARVYDRKHACTYCGQLCAKIARHLVTKHKMEEEVMSALAHKKKSSERRTILDKLRLQGDYHHNMNTLETGEGELIIVRRPGEDGKYRVEDFLPCEFCLGFFRRWDLWKHQTSCPHKTESSGQYKHVQQSAKMLIAPIITGTDNAALSRILCSMNRGEIAEIVKKDELIKALGAFLLEKDGERDRQLVSQKMREMGRLLQRLKIVEKNEKAQLSDFIRPEKFDVVIRAVKETAGFKDPDHGLLDVSIPSLALKLGHSLSKCATLLHNQAIRARNEEMAKEIKDFQKLMRSEWEYKISHHSLSTLKDRKMNSVQVLPLAEDMAMLRQFVDKEITETSSQLKESPTPNNWNALARLLLARVVMLNKRRGGEASRLLMRSFNSIPEWTKNATSEILASLSPLEQRLSKRLNMVETRGKRGRKVPIILTPDITKGINLLNSLRSKVGINEENGYVFARVNRDSLEPLRGWDCLRYCATECQPKLKNPDAITSTKLRKYIATITQVLSLEEKELDWLAKHLGHDIRTHREYYRLHESTIEIAKISKLLLAVDSGKACSLKGKSLEEITLEDISEPELSEDEKGDCEETNSDEVHAEKPQTSATLHHRGSAAKTGGQSYKAHGSKVSSGSAAKSKGKQVHLTWSKEEKKCVLDHLGHLIRQGKVPNKKESCDCILKGKDVLKDRDWKSVKYWIKNQITKRKNTKS
ncbi:uncharacterized protein LOC114542174 isoform X2 [Dendronephthya gigantea]|uniref:uncharacterized protein LOC114542174 isoform X2 n=1 Tax=Dendronephthya gigantea TaxID=151771 RepID=UPI00106AB2B5|nr:uncharacterized protein LOC114542174 isoform X2 [Dendronephthya gigantea]